MKRIIFLLLFFLFLLVPNNSYASEIVSTNETYTYGIMVSDLTELAETYPDLIEYKSIGKTPYNRDIWAIKLGHGDTSVFINGSHHAREWITTILNMKMIETYADAYQNDLELEGYRVKELLEGVTIWFVPMVNPDGVTLQQKGVSAFPREDHSSLIKMNGGSTDFKRWKANAQGIDLNRNYPANWNKTSGYKNPYWWNHNGLIPFETLENKAIRDFTYEINPQIAVSYHSSGRIIFWHFHNLLENLNRDYRLASIFSEKTGYDLVKPRSNPSGKGYTDWFIQEFGRPAFTPELSYHVGNTHVPLSVFPEIWKRNKDIGLWIAAEGYDIKNYAKQNESFNEQIKLTNRTSLYEQPSFTTKSNQYLEPETFQGIEKMKNWYRIQTPAGNKWVRVPFRLENFPDRTFVDVTKDFWARHDIDFVKDHEWMLGTSTENFSPDKDVTRTQMAVILVRILDLPLLNPDIPTFDDINKNHWAYKEIETAKAYNLFNGINETMFGDRQPISRQQMAAVLARMSGQELIETNQIPFPDVTLTDWALKEITLMRDMGVFSGFGDGSFKPKGSTTRAQIATLLKRVQTQYPDMFVYEEPVVEETNQSETENKDSLEQEEVKESIDGSAGENLTDENIQNQ